jgi:hypothetical protein
VNNNPRNVRNFWIELKVDGKAEPIECGPRNKDGGFQMTIYQRDAGAVATAFEIIGEADSEGRLTVEIRQRNGGPCAASVTNR